MTFEIGRRSIVEVRKHKISMTNVVEDEIDSLG